MFGFESADFSSGLDIHAKTLAGLLVGPHVDVQFKLLASMLNFTMSIVAKRMSRNLPP
jgi:hypothetical protein